MHTNYLKYMYTQVDVLDNIVNVSNSEGGLSKYIHASRILLSTAAAAAAATTAPAPIYTLASFNSNLW